MEISSKQILAEAIMEFGVDEQIGMLHEEVGELLSAINKYKRGRVTEREVVTEIADVQIIVEQMAYIFGESAVEAERERKLLRLRDRIAKHKNV